MPFAFLCSVFVSDIFRSEFCFLVHRIESPRRKHAEIRTFLGFASGDYCVWRWCFRYFISKRMPVAFLFSFLCLAYSCTLSALNRSQRTKVCGYRCRVSVLRLGIVACGDNIDGILSEAVCHLFFYFCNFCFLYFN